MGAHWNGRGSPSSRSAFAALAGGPNRSCSSEPIIGDHFFEKRKDASCSVREKTDAMVIGVKETRLATLRIDHEVADSGQQPKSIDSGVTEANRGIQRLDHKLGEVGAGIEAGLTSARPCSSGE